MLTVKDYCDYDTCVALKELGYNEPSNWTWYKNLRVSDEILEKYPDLSEGGYQDLIWEGKHTHDEVYKVYIEPIEIFSYNSYINDLEAEICSCAHLYDAQKWLREEKRICVEVDCCAGGYVWELCKAYHKDWFSGGTTIYTHCCEDNAINPLLNDCGKYDSYEEALLEGIKEAIKILKEERK